MGTLPGLIEALMDPRAYPERPASVSLGQTHISYLLFTPSHVYKIKKPVDFGFLDFTTLEKRRRFCHEEVRLNKRLAPRVYEGVVRVVKRGDGFAFSGPATEGRAIEYAVKMKRLGEKTMLKDMIERDEVSLSDIRRVARKIAAFHLAHRTSPHIKAFGRPAVIRKNMEENFSQALPFMGRTISRGRFDRIQGFSEGFLGEKRRLFLGRMRQGFIRDCHGDIHSDHISISRRVEIIDCIEFNERFRYSDTVSDMAFLSMDLDYLFRGDLSSAFEDAYIRAAGDHAGMELLLFYKCYRAFVRGKVEGFKTAEPEVNEKDRQDALFSALRHFHLASLYAKGGARPLMVVFRGLSGTGKTTLAQAFSRHTGMPRVSSDVVRKGLAGVGMHERAGTGFGKGIYSEGLTERTYSELIARAEGLLGSGRSVMLDATFSRNRFLVEAKDIARKTGALFHVIECRANDDAIRERLRKRGAEASVSDADWGIYLRQKRLFEPAGTPHFILDTDAPPERLMEKVFRKIFG